MHCTSSARDNASEQDIGVRNACPCSPCLLSVLALRGTTLRVVMRVADQKKSNGSGGTLDRVARFRSVRVARSEALRRAWVPIRLATI